MKYFGCHSILDKGSTVAHCKNDQLQIIGLGVQASLIPKESPRELGC